MKERTKLFSLQVSIKWLRTITRIAKRECRTQASVIRQAIKEFLERDKTKTWK